MVAPRISDSSEMNRASPVLARVFDLFKIGIGPSSSHTMGPMKAAANFIDAVERDLQRLSRLRVTLLGSLAWTGKGHATDKAIVLGLAGYDAATISTATAEAVFASALSEKVIRHRSGSVLTFDPAEDIVFDRSAKCTVHPNTMWFEAFDRSGNRLLREVWFSVGGGFVVREGGELQSNRDPRPVPYSFHSAASLLDIAKTSGLSIAEVVLANESAWQTPDQVRADVLHLAEVMFDCIARGLSAEGELPGRLRVPRRARKLFQSLEQRKPDAAPSPTDVMDRVSAFAIAVNEENAAGGRVVTAPTNGAAGVVPAVMRYYRDLCAGAGPDGILTFLLTAAAFGAIIKYNASISGAEAGCQGEVGSAAAMAAAGLCAALGGSNAQIENAAEIAMEHHLGMTCDPVGGLVQIPCIERNAFGAIKAINAASLALRGDGTHVVSFDQVVETMRQTGRDMKSNYKETSRGGLAVNVIEC